MNRGAKATIQVVFVLAWVVAARSPARAAEHSTFTIVALPDTQYYSDFQDNPDGGEGDLRILRFDIPTNRLEVETYSPLLDRATTSFGSRFGFDVEFGETIRVAAPVGCAAEPVPNGGRRATSPSP